MIEVVAQVAKSLRGQRVIGGDYSTDHLLGTVLGPQDRKGRRVCEIRNAVRQCSKQLFVNHMDLFTLRTSERAVPVGIVLQVDSQRDSERVAAIGITPMDRTTMVKADLSFPQGHGHADDLTTVAVEFRLYVLEVLAVEEPEILEARPLVTPVDDDERSCGLVAVMEWNPRSKHLVRCAVGPVRAVGVPSDRAMGDESGRLVDELVVQQADPPGPGEASRDCPDDGLKGKLAKVAVLQGDELVIAHDILVVRLPVAIPA